MAPSFVNSEILTAAPKVSVYATDVDGYIYTSPTLYVKFPRVSAHDDCGQVGPVPTSLTLAFSSGELSTFEWTDLGSGQSDFHTATSALNVADLPCGPWNGTNHFLPDPYSNQTGPYQPLIVLPSKLVSMIPAWSGCTADIFEGQDPPRTLTPAANMGPGPTNADPVLQSTAAAPSQSIPHLPLETGATGPQSSDPTSNTDSPNSNNDPPDPQPADPPTSQDPPPDNADPSIGDPAQQPAEPASPSPQANYPVSSNDPSIGNSGDPNLPQPTANDGPADPRPPNPTPNPAALVSSAQPIGHPATDDKLSPDWPPAIAVLGQTLTDGAPAATVDGTPVAYQSGSVSAGNELYPIPTGWGQDDAHTQPIVVGGLTFSPIPSAGNAGGNPPFPTQPVANGAYITSSPTPDLNPAAYITVGGETIAVDPDGISVAGMTLKPGDPGITIDGTPISLGSSVFVVGSRTETLSPPATGIAALPSFMTVGGEVLSIGSSALVVDGSTLKPGDPGITIDGTPISLGSSVFVVGSLTETFASLGAAITAPPSFLTFNGETFAVGSSALTIDGTTLKAGDPGILIDGTSVSLGPSALVVGTQTTSFTLPAAAADPASSGGIGAMIMLGLGGIGAGIIATPTTPTTTANIANGTWVGNSTVQFMGGTAQGTLQFGRYLVVVWTVVMCFIW